MNISVKELVGRSNTTSTGFIAYSADGVNWTQVNIPGTVAFGSVEFYNGKFYLGDGATSGIGQQSFGRVYTINANFDIGSFAQIISASVSPVADAENGIVNFKVYNGILYMFQGLNRLSCYRLVGDRFLLVPWNQPATGNRMAVVFNNDLLVSGGAFLFSTMKNY